LPKNNKTGIAGRKKEAFTFERKVASASNENSVHLHRNTQLRITHEVEHRFRSNLNPHFAAK
jgi:hypothetical protein